MGAIRRAAIAGMRFTLLDGSPAVRGIDEKGLSELYGYPDRPTLRANMIASVDGAATTGGLSGGLGGLGDRQVFAALRELSDVIVVGAGTARAENYGVADMTVAGRRRRRSRGQAEVPPVAMVTRSGVLQPNLPVLTRSEVAPLVLTCAAAVAGSRDRLGAAAEVLDCSGSDPTRVDLAVAVQVLAARGLTRVLTEGGPSLLGAFVEAGLLDELCLTTAPLLTAGDGPRITAGSVESPTPMRRAHLLTDDEGYLYARYLRAG